MMSFVRREDNKGERKRQSKTGKRRINERMTRATGRV